MHLSDMSPLLVVTAVEPEAAAVRAGLAAHPAPGPTGLTDAAGTAGLTETTGPNGPAGTGEAAGTSDNAGWGETAEGSRAAIHFEAPPKSEAAVTVTVAAVGVGAAEAAAGTARLLALAEAAGTPYAGVISAGIGGGLPGRAVIGDTVIATRSIAADLGADSPDGYLPIERLGFGNSAAPVDEGLFALLRDVLPEAVAGDVLTVNTVTGTGARAAELAGRHPAAVAEAMEGYGVAAAARAAGVPFAELRTISNPVGPRDRAAWNLPAAFTALTTSFAALTRPAKTSGPA